MWGMDYLFSPKPYIVYSYLSVVGLKLFYTSKTDPLLFISYKWMHNISFDDITKYD